MAQPLTDPTPEWPAHYTTLAPFASVFRQGLPILTYHVIGPRPRRAKMKGLYLSPALFDRQLAELRQAGFITPPYDRAADTRSNPRPEILLTMDDGVRKTSECSLPILQKHGCRAIQFIVAHCIGSMNECQTR